MVFATSLGCVFCNPNTHQKSTGAYAYTQCVSGTGDEGVSVVVCVTTDSAKTGEGGGEGGHSRSVRLPRRKRCLDLRLGSTGNIQVEYDGDDEDGERVEGLVSH
jgi:hypothetical protein